MAVLGKTVFIFPGQGSQYVGMGRELWEAHEDVRLLYRSASEAAGLDIGAVSFEGPRELLDSDINAQLAVFVCNEAHRMAAMKAGLLPQAVTGYSLGFYSALVAAGCLSFADALRAVRIAGELSTARPGEGTMAAIIGLDKAQVEDICSKAKQDGGVWVSNLNAARQILVSGSVGDVGRAVALAQEKGALSAYRLYIGAAYHSPMMSGASEAFSGALKVFKFNPPAVPLLSYIDAAYLADAEAVRDTVGRQLRSQVLWKDSVLRLIGDGYDRFVEVGPGEALSRMVRWVDRSVEAVTAVSLYGR